MTAQPRGELIEEQRVVVGLPADARAFLVAGPGTGKTHVLVHRVAQLLRLDLAASEVLVLSFSNAVVGELRRRLGDHDETNATYVRPVTIDSFAGRILTRAGEAAMRRGFDETVRQATTLVTESAGGSLLSHVRHVIVDEAQDLVGVRLDFVAAILHASPGGFTVLGDPAQGIYGFTKTAGGAVTGIEALQTTFPSAATMYLTHDHRSLRADAAPGQALRAVVTESDARAAHSVLVRRLQDSDRLTTAQLPTVLRRADSATGVLCRTNGEALVLAELMADAGVDHTVRRAAAANVPPAWVARALRDMTSAELSRERFTELVQASQEWTDGAWKAIRRLAGGRSGRVDVGLLRERIGGLRAEEAPDMNSAPVISTIHRSKGLEYDTVIVLEPHQAPPEDEPGDEARVLYVAMTRARRRTIRLERPDIPGRLVRRRGRWALVPWRGRGLSRIELRAGDVATTLDDGLDESEIRTQQDYLRDHVRTGDPVVLSLLNAQGGYAIHHKSQRIGMTSSAFASFSDDFPARIDHVRIDCLRSAAGDPARTANLELGGGGFWLVPELVGLGLLAWKDSS